MCAIVGCATPPSPRQATDLANDLKVTGEIEPGAKPALERAQPFASSRADAADSDDDEAVGARLPWLGPSHIGAAVGAHRSDFQACQALGDVLSQREDGAVTVGWAVRANGSVNQVTLGPSSFHSDPINLCVLGVARQVSFPPSAAPTHVSWTVQFRGALHGPLADATPR